MTTSATDSAVERLIFTDLVANNNKYWDIEQTGTNVVTRWGRVGATRGQSKQFSFPNDSAASAFFDKKIKEKMKKGYTKQYTMAPAGGGGVSVARKVEIAHDGGETAQLIDFLVRRNVHKIEGLTNVRLEAGRLTTPLGPVTAEGLDEAERILSGLSEARTSTKKFNDLANAYMRIIPRNIGMRRVDPVSLFGTTALLQTEQATIDSLRAVVDDLADKATQAAEESPVTFETSLASVPDDSTAFQHIARLFGGSKNRNHTSANLRLRKVWEMSIASQVAAFEADLKPVMELWHGSKDVNLLSILKNGFIIPKRSQGVQITGRMYGDGVYFSDQSTKALNYAGSFWGGQASQRSFMLLSDVAMGKQYVPQRPFSGGCPRGYDSTFAKAGTAVRNNEMIVYRTSQIRAKYLCEFGR